MPRAWRYIFFNPVRSQPEASKLVAVDTDRVARTMSGFRRDGLAKAKIPVRSHTAMPGISAAPMYPDLCRCCTNAR